MVTRYYLDTDNDSHWYLIPVQHREEWNEWLEIDSDDERAWTPPAFAEALGGSPTGITFENPKYE